MFNPPYFIVPFCPALWSLVSDSPSVLYRTQRRLSSSLSRRRRRPRPPPRVRASAPSAIRRGRFHSRFCLAGAARKACNTSAHSAHDGGTFLAPGIPLTRTSRFRSLREGGPCFKKRAHPSQSSSSGYSFFARAHPRGRRWRWRCGGRERRAARVAVLLAAWLLVPRCNLYLVALGRRELREEVEAMCIQSVSRVE